MKKKILPKKPYLTTIPGQAFLIPKINFTPFRLRFCIFMLPIIVFAFHPIMPISL